MRLTRIVELYGKIQRSKVAGSSLVESIQRPLYSGRPVSAGGLWPLKRNSRRSVTRLSPSCLDVPRNLSTARARASHSERRASVAAVMRSRSGQPTRAASVLSPPCISYELHVNKQVGIMIGRRLTQYSLFATSASIGSVRREGNLVENIM